MIDQFSRREPVWRIDRALFSIAIDSRMTRFAFLRVSAEEFDSGRVAIAYPRGVHTRLSIRTGQSARAMLDSSVSVTVRRS